MNNLTVNIILYLLKETGIMHCCLYSQFYLHNLKKINKMLIKTAKKPQIKINVFQSFCKDADCCCTAYVTGKPVCPV